jgi:hypothetical protein
VVQSAQRSWRFSDVFILAKRQNDRVRKPLDETRPPDQCAAMHLNHLNFGNADLDHNACYHAISATPASTGASSPA